MVSLAELIANVVAAIHIAYFLFVIGGFVSIVIGPRKRWEWIRNPWFRLAHLASVYVVIVEDIFHFQCPLNTVETNLRTQSSPVGAMTSTAGHFLDFLLHQTIPSRVLDVMYWTLGVILVVLLFVVPPRFTTYTSSNREK